MVKRIDGRAELVALVETIGSQKGAAERLGISQQYVNDLLAGRRSFSKTMLGKLGLETIVVKRKSA